MYKIYDFIFPLNRIPRNLIDLPDLAYDLKNWANGYGIDSPYEPLSIFVKTRLLQWFPDFRTLIGEYRCLRNQENLDIHFEIFRFKTAIIIRVFY